MTATSGRCSPGPELIQFVEHEDDEIVVAGAGASFDRCAEAAHAESGLHELLGAGETVRADAVDGRRRRRSRRGAEYQRSRFVDLQADEEVDEVAQRGPLMGPVPGSTPVVDDGPERPDGAPWIG